MVGQFVNCHNVTINYLKIENVGEKLLIGGFGGIRLSQLLGWSCYWAGLWSVQ